MRPFGLYCPVGNCKNHCPDKDVIFKRHSLHKNNSGTWIRYKCPECGRTFTIRTLSLNHWAQIIIDYEELEKKLSSGQNMRSIALDYNCSHKVVQNRARRLALNSIAFNIEVMDQLVFNEDLAADGIENFIGSQYYPCDFNLLIGKRSGYNYNFTWSLMRRKGKTTERQKLLKPIYERDVDYNTNTITKGFLTLLDYANDLIKTNPEKKLNFITDKKTQYAYALRKHPRLGQRLEDKSIKHIRIDSKLPRTQTSPMAVVNSMDRDIRKDRKDFTRETICFPRNTCNCMERLVCYFHYHNYRKKFRINDPKEKNNLRHADMAFKRTKNILDLQKWRYIGRATYLDVYDRIREFEKRIWLRAIDTPGRIETKWIPQYQLTG